MAGSRRLTVLADAVLARVEPHLPDGPLVIALSGGADSAVCGWSAAQLRSHVRAVHIDHGWPASPTLRSAAVDLAANLGLALSVREVRARPGPSPEGQARTVRHEAFRDEVASAEWLLTGHTRDDQAETVLGNLLRGSGAFGLAGIPRRRGKILRPLLDVDRSETRELAALLNLPWIDDPTNSDGTLRRNALRREIIPYLEARMNPSFRAALVRMAGALGQDDRYFDAAAGEIPIEQDGSSVRLPAPLLATVPGPVAARAVRRALRYVKDGYPGSSIDVAAILTVAQGGPPIELSGTIRVERVGVWVALSRSGSQPNLPTEQWGIPGRLETGLWSLEAWVEQVPPAAFPISSFVEVFDADLLPDQLTVRTSKPDDRVAIVGGTKAVRDVLAEARVPVARRSSWPLVLAGEQPIWVPGARRADAGWVGKHTRRYLWVRATVEGHS